MLEANFFASSPHLLAHLFKFIQISEEMSLMDTLHESLATFSLSKLCQCNCSNCRNCRNCGQAAECSEVSDGTRSFAKPSNHLQRNPRNPREGRHAEHAERMPEISEIPGPRDCCRPTVANSHAKGLGTGGIGDPDLHSINVSCSYHSSNHRTEEESRKHKPSLILVQTKVPLSNVYKLIKS